MSYTDLLDTGERRRKHLQKYYLFCCSCDRCHDDKMEGSLNSLMYSTRAIGGKNVIGSSEQSDHISGVTESEKKRLMSDGFSKLEEAEKLKNKRDILHYVITSTDYMYMYMFTSTDYMYIFTQVTSKCPCTCLHKYMYMSLKD